MKKGKSPGVWLAGDPEDLKKWMQYGVTGIVTNTVVQRELTEKYGSLIDLTTKYLEITDRKIAIEIDGNSTQELLDVGEVFTKMSDQIILKIPCSEIGLGAFVELKKEGVETFCTTVFSLNQAVAVAQAGADHILPFCEPMKEIGVSPTKLVKECYETFKDWNDRPKITAALVRSVDVAHSAFLNGADGIIVFWPIFKEMLENTYTDKWNKIFMDEWKTMNSRGHLKGLPIQLDE
jgi:transaldolase